MGDRNLALLTMYPCYDILVSVLCRRAMVAMALISGRCEDPRMCCCFFCLELLAQFEFNASCHQIEKALVPTNFMYETS